MDNLIIQAYKQAKTKDFFAITTRLEKILRQRYTTADPRFAITTGQVRRILARNNLDFHMAKSAVTGG